MTAAHLRGLWASVLLQKLSAVQMRSPGIEGNEARATKVRRSGGEQAVGEVSGRELVKQVERLFDRGVMLELDAGGLQHRDEGGRHRLAVHLVAAAENLLGLKQRT